MDRWMYGQTDRQVERWTDRQIDGEKTDQYVGQETLSDQLIEGQADEQSDRQTS